MLKMAGGRMHAPHPTLPVSAPDLKLQKQLKESGIFQSLGTINFVLFTNKSRIKEGGMAQSHTDIFQTSQTYS